MGSPNTTHATARTAISYMKGIDMSKLLEELVAEYKASLPPKDAVTVKQLAKELGKSADFARDILNEKVKNHGWIKQRAGYNKVHYWKPVD